MTNLSLVLLLAAILVGCRHTTPKSDSSQADTTTVVAKAETMADSIEEEREGLTAPYVPTERDYKVCKYKYTPQPTATSGIITAPYEDFFFADLDFDGKEELIAGVQPLIASQRGVGVFTEIYKIIDGDIVNYTKYFQAQSDIFNHIEQYFFSVNTNTKSIMLWSDGGINNWGWDVYDYRNGKYVYRHYVSVERDWQVADSIQVSIYPNSGDRVKGKNLLKQFKTTQEEYDKHHWEY